MTTEKIPEGLESALFLEQLYRISILDGRIALPEQSLDRQELKSKAQRLRRNIQASMRGQQSDWRFSFDELKSVVQKYIKKGRPDYHKIYEDGGSQFFSQFVSRIIAIDAPDDHDDHGDLDLVGVPDQRPSPIYVKISDNRITLDKGSQPHALIRSQAIETTRGYLKKEAEELLDELKRTNADPKLIIQFAKLISMLDFDDDSQAITLALHSRMLSQAVSVLEDELSTMNYVQISAVLTATSNFVSQYRDWVEFTENAQGYSSRNLVENDIDAAIDRVENLLSAAPDVVDERIPESFSLIAKLLQAKPIDRTNAIYAGIRGFENVCIAAIKFAYDQVISLLRESTTNARSLAAKMAGTGIVFVTLNMMGAFDKIISHAPELRWLIDNSDKIKKIADLINSLIK